MGNGNGGGIVGKELVEVAVVGKVYGGAGSLSPSHQLASNSCAGTKGASRVEMCVGWTFCQARGGFSAAWKGFAFHCVDRMGSSLWLTW